MFLRLLSKFGVAHLVDHPTYIYDDDDREDRISNKNELIRRAVIRISHKFESINSDAKYHLFMQMFNGYDDLSPDINDMIFLLRNRPTLRYFRRLLKAFVKDRLIGKKITG